MPSTKYVKGSNNCYISFGVFKESQKMVIFSAIDNLIKGASGQAVQNMNIMFGLDETIGLKHIATYL
jgi:N-acetyl-gamma-glutamyl-phosphate reductase